MGKNTKDIPIELDMKILEYAAGKQFRKSEKVYRYILKVAAVLTFAAVVGVFASVRLQERALRNSEELALEAQIEQFYAELSLITENFDESCAVLNEKLNEELQNNFTIAYVE